MVEITGGCYHMEDFVTDADCVLLKLEFESYYVVSQSQNVVEWRVT